MNRLEVATRLLSALIAVNREAFLSYRTDSKKLIDGLVASSVDLATKLIDEVHRVQTEESLSRPVPPEPTSVPSNGVPVP